MIRLSQYEQETILNYNMAEKTANVYTHDGALIRRLEKLCADRPGECVPAYNQSSHGKSYDIPKKWIKINPTRIMSEEQRAASADRLRRMKLSKYP